MVQKPRRYRLQDFLEGLRNQGYKRCWRQDVAFAEVHDSKIPICFLARNRSNLHNFNNLPVPPNH